MQIAVGSSSLKIVALTIRAHFYVNPGKNITNRYYWFSVLTNAKDKVKFNLLEKINYFEYIYIFILVWICWALKVPLQDWLIINIIEKNKEQFGLKSYEWFQNRTGAHHKYDFRPKLYDTVFNHHLIKIWKRKIQSLKHMIFLVGLRKYFIDPLLSCFIKSCKSCLSFSWNLIGYLKEALKSDGCCVLVKLSHWQGKKCD